MPEADQNRWLDIISEQISENSLLVDKLLCDSRDKSTHCVSNAYHVFSFSALSSLSSQAYI